MPPAPKPACRLTASPCGRSYPKFFSVYLEDWRVKPSRVPPGESLLKKDEGVEEHASPIADDWDVDFGAEGFGELTVEKRIKLALVIFLKLVGVFGALYFFICALSFLADGFRLVSSSTVVAQQWRWL